MNHPIAVFYHCRIAGGSPSIDPDYGALVMAEQMRALRQSLLEEAASEIMVGCIGSDAECLAAAQLAPEKARVVFHGPNACTEIPTLKLLHDWLPAHPDWYVLYHHTKGVTHTREAFYEGWRRRMESACVWQWQRCVVDLAAGFDACGCHWLTPEQFPGTIKSPFFGGTFWWSTARFLLTLPPLPEATWANRFEAESWIGKGPKRPKVRDYHPGWP